jgi:uncharacterized protein related to proFAR isomerase
MVSCAPVFNRRWSGYQPAAGSIVGKAEVMRATKGSENVFVDCGFSPAEAENLRIRAKMMVALTDYIQERKITQSRAAGLKVDVDITAGGPRAKSKRVA